MQHKTKGAMIVLVVLAAFLWLVPSIAEAAGPLVCVNGATDGPAIAKALGKLKPVPGKGTLVLSGTCSANIVIRTGGITVDGGGTATVDAALADPGEAVIRVRARGVTIKGLILKNGDGGVSISGTSNARIDNNEIGPNAGGTGVSVSQESAAIITNNNIHDNQDGILINDNSTARIGFADTEDVAASPNNIHNNTRDGIRVFRSSSARIFGNSAISSNTKKGINVDRMGMVEAAGNTLDSNGETGITVRQNSAVNLGTTVAGTNFQTDANTTNVNNTGKGISCKVGGYVAGKIGTLNGTTGATEFGALGTNDQCLDKTVP